MGRLSRSAVLLGVAVLVLTGGGAYALGSSLSGGTITVCVTHKGGALYKAKSCKKHDKKLSWNKQGRPGATGATGATGPAGPTGPQGPAGPPVGSVSGAWSASSANLSGCDDVVVHSETFTLSRASAIYASGSATYQENGANLQSGILHFLLYDAAGTTIVASSGLSMATVDSATQRGEISIAQVLMPGDVIFGSGVYTAPPGQYTLKLVGTASDGGCSGAPLLWRPAMSYFTLG